MKISTKILIALLFLCLFTISSRAFVLFQDNFSYPPGTLTNNTWVAGAGNTLPANLITVTSTNTVVMANGTTASDAPRAYFTNGLSSYSLQNGTVFNSTNSVYYFPSNAPVAALYASFTISLSGSDTSGAYFAMFTDTNFEYVPRLFVTNGPSANTYQLTVQDSSTFITTNLSGSLLLNPTILNANTAYLVVVRYVLSSGTATLWVNPTSETGPVNANSTTANSVTCIGPSFVSTTPGVSGFGLHNYSGSEQIIISNLIVGTTFADAVPSSAGLNPPFVVTQPQNDPSGYVGAPSAVFSAVVGGDPATYQWYQNTNTQLQDQSGAGAIIGSVSNVLTLTNLTLTQAGTYDCAITNAAGGTNTSFATLAVYAEPVAPVITNQPASVTNVLGDTVPFSVVAGGIPPPSYQWYYITNSSPAKTNVVSGANVAVSTSSFTNTLTFTAVNTNQAGSYFVVVSNAVGAVTSSVVTLTISQPQFFSIAQLDTMVDGSYDPTNTTRLLTIQGTNCVWTNLTTSGNCEFYLVDNTAGIEVFWSGAAASTNFPRAGAVVKITAPLAVFDGQLEIEPVFGNKQQSVTFISTNNLPAPQPLPFDPNILNNSAAFYSYIGGYYVASNVTLQAEGSFPSGQTISITNNAYDVVDNSMFDVGYTNPAGASFTQYVVQYTDIPGRTQPTGPVTIKGVLGYHNSSGYVGAIGSPGAEFEASRDADIITYVNVTNVLSHLIRQGDLVTNTFNQSFLEPNETLTTYASIADPEGGSVTLTPSYTGLSADASWSGLTSGQTASGVFHFTPTAADQGSNYVVSLNVTSTSGNNYTYSFTVYVPTPDEQQVYISEVFANPTTNTASPAYNPLQRGSGDFGVESNIPVADQYIELANLSPDAVTLNGGRNANWTLGNGLSTLHIFNNDVSSGALSSGNAYVIYGGANASVTDPSYPNILGGYNNSGSVEPVNSGESLNLSTNGGIITLYNASGYLVDRVVYPSSALNTSFSRFPTLNSGMVPQQYISTNYTTAGFQYDGGSWSAPTKVPTSVTNVTVTLQSTNVIFKFPVNSSQAYTLWNSATLPNAFSVIYGRGSLTQPSAKMTNNVSGPRQFYFITTQ